MADYLLLAVVLISVACLGIIVFRADSSNPANKSFSLLLAWVVFWITCNFFEPEVRNKAHLSLLFKLDFASACWIAYYFLLFCLYFPVPSFKKNPTKLLLSLTCLACIASLSPYVITDTQILSEHQQPTFTLGPLFWLYVPVVGGFIFGGIILMYQKKRRLQGIARTQASYVLLGLTISGVMAVIVNLGIASFFPISVTMSRIGIYSILALAWLPAYAMIRYRLMDISLIMRGGLAYGALGLAATAVFLTILYLTERVSESMSVTPGIASIFAIMVAVTVYETWNLKLRVYIDQFIYQSPDMKELIQQIQMCVTESKNMHQLADSLAIKIKNIWKVDHAGIVTWNSNGAHFQPLPHGEFNELSINTMDEKITSADFLIKTLESERRLFHYGVIQDDELVAYCERALPGEKATFQKIRRTMRWLGASICVPIMNGNNLIGFIVLGKKLSGVSYNREDKKILSHVGDILSSVTMQMTFDVA